MVYLYVPSQLQPLMRTHTSGRSRGGGGSKVSIEIPILEISTYSSCSGSQEFCLQTFLALDRCLQEHSLSMPRNLANSITSQI